MNRVLSALDHVIFFSMTIAVAGALTASVAPGRLKEYRSPRYSVGKVELAHHFCEAVEEVLEEHREESTNHLRHDEVDNIIDNCYEQNLNGYL